MHTLEKRKDYQYFDFPFQKSRKDRIKSGESNRNETIKSNINIKMQYRKSTLKVGQLHTDLGNMGTLDTGDSKSEGGSQAKKLRLGYYVHYLVDVINRSPNRASCNIPLLNKPAYVPCESKIKIKKIESWYFEKISNIDKSLSRLINEKDNKNYQYQEK